MKHRQARILLGVVTATIALFLVVQYFHQQETIEPQSVESNVTNETPSVAGDFTKDLQILTDVKAGSGDLPETDGEDGLIAAQEQSDRDQLWSPYDVVFGKVTPTSPLSQIHSKFKNEPRDESWASAMENGIGLSILPSEETARITVEHIECRSTICEVAGFMPDTMEYPDIEPRELFSNDFGDGWWQGRINTGVGVHTYEGEEISRFIVIIAESDEFLRQLPDELR